MDKIKKWVIPRLYGRANFKGLKDHVLLATGKQMWRILDTHHLLRDEVIKKILRAITKLKGRGENYLFA
ncbi:MAG: hypothetical protein EOP48_02790 [Sphingobacteriales bacterium]|nr:MAG: hypothetical protein EOP48_02790 [Sphingobacteriales bacterium]